MSKLLGNELLALVRNSDDLGRFWENPGLAETALEELLRYFHVTCEPAVADLPAVQRASFFGKRGLCCC